MTGPEVVAWIFDPWWHFAIVWTIVAVVGGTAFISGGGR